MWKTCDCWKKYAVRVKRAAFDQSNFRSSLQSGTVKFTPFFLLKMATLELSMKNNGNENQRHHLLRATCFLRDRRERRERGALTAHFIEGDSHFARKRKDVLSA